MKKDPQYRIVKTDDGQIIAEPEQCETGVQRFFRDLPRVLSQLDPTAGMAEQERRRADQARRHNEMLRQAVAAKARKEAEAVAREEAMVRELAAANERAQAAEEREQQQGAERVKRERFLVKCTVVSTLAAVAAVVVPIIAG